MQHYEIRIEKTVAELFSSDYYREGVEVEKFPTLEAARAFVAERYAGKKRGRIYIDGDNGEPTPVGWVYKFRDDGRNCADWVELNEVTVERIAL